MLVGHRRTKVGTENIGEFGLKDTHKNIYLTCAGRLPQNRGKEDMIAVFFFN